MKVHCHFKNKTIFIISTQAWGDIRVSKHHYATELAAKQNKVYFINPPSNRINGVQIQPVSDTPNLFVVDFNSVVPNFFRFHAKFVYPYLVRLNIRRIINKIGLKPEIVWSFGNEFFPELASWGAKLKIFHPVDNNLTDNALIARKADYIFSVSPIVLERFRNVSAKKFFIDHGLSKAFTENYNIRTSTVDSKINIGYIGNLLIKGIDRPRFLEIVSKHADVNFHMFGPFSYENNNLSGFIENDALEFIETLKAHSNVTFHGVLTQDKLAKTMNELDGFLMCYNRYLDHNNNGNFNSHKVLEILSTGKVLISHRIDRYIKEQGLFEMVEEDHNEYLPELFSNVIKNLAVYNSKDLMEKRRNFALQFTYERNLELINNLIESNNDSV